MKTKLSLFCEKLIEIGWLAAAIVAPLFFNVYSNRVFEPDKLTLVRSIATLMAVAWVIKVLDEAYMGPEEGKPEGKPSSYDAEASVQARDVYAQESQKQALKRLWGHITATPLLLPTLALVAVYLLSTAASLVPRVSLLGSYQRLQGTYTTFSYIVIFLLVLQGMRRREQIERLITVLILVSLPISLYGLVQHAKLDPLPWGGDVTRRVASNMGNAIFVAAYLIMVVPLTMARLIGASKHILENVEESKGAVFLVSYLLLQVIQIFIWVRFEYLIGLWTGLGVLIILLFFSLFIEKPLAHFALLGGYSFILNAQLVCILFSGSRGPWLGLLGGLYVFVLISLISLRRQAEDQSRLSFGEIGRALAFALVSLPAMLALPYALLIFLKRGFRWLWLSWLIQAFIGILLLLAVSLPVSPLHEPFKRLPYVGHLSSLLDTTGGTNAVRILIWEGATQLIMPHEPLRYPSGEPDTLNFLRPLIGYGPESMYVAYNRFYPPKLAHHEARNASPDRSHNETFDALVITGLLGFVVYMLIFGSVFYYALKWLGLISSRLQRWVFVAFWLGGGFLGVLISWLTDGTLRFLGVGLPTGSILGLALYVGLYGLVFYGQREGGDILDWGYRLYLIALLSAIMAHFIEVHFGIAIAATRTYFWLYAGLICVIGYFLRQGQAVPSPALESTPPLSLHRRGEEGGVARLDEPRSRKKRRRKKPENVPSGQAATLDAGQAGWNTALVSFSLLMGLILITMCYDYITFQYKISDGEGSIFWLFAITWLLAGAIIITELSKGQATGQADWVFVLVTYPLISLACLFLFYFIHHLWLDIRDVSDSPIKAADRVAGVIALYYVVLFGMIFLITLTSLKERGSEKSSPLFNYGYWWLYPILAVAALYVIIFFNLKFIQADIYYKQAAPYEQAGRWDDAVEMYRRALRLDPYEDYYFLFLGRACLEKAQRMGESPNDALFSPNLDTLLRPTAWEQEWLKNTGRETWLRLSEVALNRAQELNPLNTDHTANLGRLYRTRGGLRANMDERIKELSRSIEYYRQATSLSPHNAQLFNEWGTVYYILGRFDKALEKLLFSLSLDPAFVNTYVHLGDAYQALNKPERALEAHVKAIEIEPGSLTDQYLFSFPIPGFLETRLNFYANSGLAQRLIQAVEKYEGDTFPLYKALGNIYIQQRKLEEAKEQFLKAVALREGDLDAHIALGYIYAQLGELEEAEREFQICIQIAPEDLISRRNLGGVYRQQAQQAEQAGDEKTKLLKLEQARAEFERTAAIAPEDLLTHQNLAEVYRLLGMAEEALKEFRRVVELAPDDWNGHKNLAIFYQQLGMIEEAISEAQKAKDLAPDDQKPTLENFISQLQKGAD